MVPPLAASTVESVLVDLFVVLLAAKVGEELMKRARQPALVGEVLAGVLIGSSVLALVDETQTLEAFAQLGVVFLLFWAGLQTPLSDMLAVGRVAVAVGALGIAVPFATGMGLALAFGSDATTALFVAAVLMVTSAGVTTAVLAEYSLLATTPGRTILGAAVVDDVLALIVVGVAAGLGGDGDVDAVETGATAVLALVFVAFFAIVGTGALRRRPEVLQLPRFADSALLPAVLLCLGLAALASAVGLAAIVGAFLAGMMLAETREHYELEREFAPLYVVFPSFFFVFIGLSVELDALASWEAAGLLAGLSVVSLVAKFAGCWFAARPLGRRDAAIVGVGMTPRGEVGIVVAGLGLAAGVVSGQLFAVLVAVSVLTTLIAPPLLRPLAAARAAAAPADT